MRSGLQRIQSSNLANFFTRVIVRTFSSRTAHTAIRYRQALKKFSSNHENFVNWEKIKYGRQA